MLKKEYNEDKENEFFESLNNLPSTNTEEEEENIGEKISDFLVTLIGIALMSTIGFGIVVGLFAIAYYCPCGPVIAIFVLFVLYGLISVINEDLFEMINYFLAMVATCVAGCMLLAFIEFFFAYFE